MEVRENTAICSVQLPLADTAGSELRDHGQPCPISPLGHPSNLMNGSGVALVSTAMEFC